MTLAAPTVPPRRRLRVSSRVVILALVSAMAGFAFALVHTVRAEKSLRARIGLTTDTVLTLDAALLAAVDVETAQRGFLLTGDAGYLAPYAAGVDALPRVIETARDLLARAEGPAPPRLAVPRPASRRIVRIAQIAETKLSELARTIDLYRAGETEAAVALVQTDNGKRAMDRLRDEVGALIAEERALLAGQERVFSRIEARTGALLATLALASLGLVLLALRLERQTARA